MNLEKELSILKKSFNLISKDINLTAILVIKLNRDQIKMYKLL